MKCKVCNTRCSTSLCKTCKQADKKKVTDRHKDCKGLQYCQNWSDDCKHKPRKKVTKKKVRVDLADPVNMKQNAFKKKAPKYEVKVKIPTTKGNWEFWL